MRDDDDNDDDGFPNEISRGKILHSGITPRNIEPAEYALDAGVPALMEESLPALGKKTTRRRFMIGTIATAVGAGIGACVGTWIIATSGQEKKEDQTKAQKHRPQLDEEQKLWIAGARALADAKLTELVVHYEPVLFVIEMYGGDETLWRGARRLATYALLKRDEEAVAVGRRLLQTFEFRTPPKELERLVPQLRELVRQRGP